MHKSKITNLTKIAPEVYTLEFPKTFSFIPGQVISLRIGEIAPRMYSIASGINESVIRILFDVKKEGLLTNILKCMHRGDWIEISEPFGNFECDTTPAFWIASGTGIAPFYSMFISGLGTNKTIIHGGRSTQSFYFQDVFSHGTKENYIRCCSQEMSDGFYHGRLTQYLKEQIDLPTTQKYYLCGSSEMVVETRDILISKGIPFGNILGEIYF